MEENKSIIEKCADCNKEITDPYFCVRCGMYFCKEDSVGHMETIECEGCCRIVCIEIVIEGKCFSCYARESVHYANSRLRKIGKLHCREDYL